MIFNPEKILRELEEHKIGELTAFELLAAIVENSSSEDVRSKAIITLVNVGILNYKVYNILENLLISDESATIRCLAATCLGDKFLDQALTPLKWSIKFEKDYNCLIEIIKLLRKLGSKDAKSVLYDEIKKIIKTKFLNKDKRIENKKYRNILKNLLKEKDYNKFTHDEFAQILINYYTISNLFKKYYNVYYEVDPRNALIKKLDLSDHFEHEVKGTPWQWKNNIKKFSEIPGLSNLKCLKELDLSNNQITSIKGLINLPNLTHIILSNNRLSAGGNLDHLTNLPNLRYLDLRGNNIINDIKLNDFHPQTRVLLKDSYIKIK
ncbi:MAG: leucine-rich repeat domain-containing protein [Promethearchaeota archaeon]|jgi:Leucine-rich repeat (LRR) protein